MIVCFGYPASLVGIPQLVARSARKAMAWAMLSISGTTHAQFAEGLHFSAFHLFCSS